MIKLSWAANGLAALVLLTVVAIVFFTQGSEPLYSQEAKAFFAPKNIGTVKKLTVLDYRAIWQSEVNPPAPEQPKTVSLQKRTCMKNYSSVACKSRRS